MLDFGRAPEMETGMRWREAFGSEDRAFERYEAHLGGFEMFKRLCSEMGGLWCSLRHESPMWPIHGQYQCRICGRRYPAFAEAPVAVWPKPIALKPALALLLAFVLAPAVHSLRAGELQPETLTAWNEYVKRADSQMEVRAAGNMPFLWMDEAPDRAARARRGEVVIAPLGRGMESVPHGLVHSWVGAIFIPGASIDSLLAVVHDYDHYRQMYPPVVTLSRTLVCTGDNQEFQMVWQRKVLFIKAAMQGHYRAHDVILGAHRGYSVVEAVEVRQIQRFGHKDQLLLPPDAGDGFIWRIRGAARFEERDGGVYLELEGMALTRDVPGSLAWIIDPMIHRMAVDSLTATLRQTRAAVMSPPRTLASSRPAVISESAATR
jgi:hypothetical protein